MESLTAAFDDLSVREKPEEKSEWSATGGWELGADDSGWNIEPSGWDDDDDEPTKDSPAPLENRKDAPRLRPPPVHYPQRPGEPDWVFYKSGSCKFGMNCKVRRRKAQGLDQDANGKKKNPSEKMEKTEDKVMKGKQNQSLSERKDQKDYKAAEEKGNFSEREEQKENKDAKSKKKNPPEKVEKKEYKVMKGKQNQYLSERRDQKDNKHYPMAGDYNATEGCKDGNFQGKAELARVELNFLGLPIRPGEIECPHYMHTGGCKFSTSCRYHHPDPTVVVGQDPVLGFHSGRPQQHMSGASAPPMTSWPFPINPSEPVPYFGVGPSYTPGFYPLPPQGLYPNPQWNGYQVPAPVLPWMHPDMNATNFQGSTSTVTGGGINQYPQVDEYPDRPGQPECRYFTRTGACEFKSACKFHHPAP